MIDKIDSSKIYSFNSLKSQSGWVLKNGKIKETTAKFQTYTKNINHSQIDSWRVFTGLKAFSITLFSLGFSLLLKKVRLLWNQTFSGIEVVKIKIQVEGFEEGCLRYQKFCNFLDPKALTTKVFSKDKTISCKMAAETECQSILVCLSEYKGLLPKGNCLKIEKGDTTYWLAQNGKIVKEVKDLANSIPFFGCAHKVSYLDETNKEEIEKELKLMDEMIAAF